MMPNFRDLLDFGNGGGITLDYVGHIDNRTKNLKDIKTIDTDEVSLYVQSVGEFAAEVHDARADAHNYENKIFYPNIEPDRFFKAAFYKMEVKGALDEDRFHYIIRRIFR